MKINVKFFKSRRSYLKRLIVLTNNLKKKEFSDQPYSDLSIHNLELLIERIDTSMEINYDRKFKKFKFDKSVIYIALNYIKNINPDYFYILLDSINTGLPEYWFLYGNSTNSFCTGTKNKCVVTVEYNNPSIQLSNLIHELGHQIDYINNNNNNPKCPFLTELLQILMELLVADDLYFNKGEENAVSIYKQRHDNIICMVKNLNFFIEYQNLSFDDKSNERIIESLYYKHFKNHERYEHIEDFIFSADKNKYIDYLLSYICAIELRKIFYQDRDLCFEKLDEIMKKRFDIKNLDEIDDLGLDIFKKGKIDIFDTGIQKYYINQ